jgi:hypothetical protein
MLLSAGDRTIAQPTSVSVFSIGLLFLATWLSCVPSSEVAAKRTHQMELDVFFWGGGGYFRKPKGEGRRAHLYFWLVAVVYLGRSIPQLGHTNNGVCWLSSLCPAQ